MSVGVVSVIHGEQLHVRLREKPSHENVGENDVKERAWVTTHVGDKRAEAEQAAKNAENYQGIPQVVLICVIYSWPVRVMWPQTSARLSTWPTADTQVFKYNSSGAFGPRVELWIYRWPCFYHLPHSRKHCVYSCVRLPAPCVVYALSACNWNGSSSRWCLFWGCSGDYISEGVQIPAARFLSEKGFLWYAPDQQWDARVAEPHADPRAEKTELAARRRISPIQSKHHPYQEALMWPYLELAEPSGLRSDTDQHLERIDLQFRSFQGGFGQAARKDLKALSFPNAKRSFC